MKVNKYMPEIICSFPWDIQKLVWIALHYQNRIREHEKCYLWLGDEANAEKLDKYVAAYERVKELIKKLSARRGIEKIYIMEGDGGKYLEETVFEE